MKRSLLALVAVLMSLVAMAQAPQKMTYQAVVRDNDGQLVSNGNVGVRISIVRGSETGAEVYSQTETVRTNDNGLFTTMIGGTGFDAIDWGNGPYYLKSEVDPDGGSNYILTTTQQMVSVPYALHAGTVDHITGGVNITETDPIFTAWNKDYNDLINKPTIPTNVSELTNDAGYLTSFTETQVLSISNDTIYLTGGSYVKLPAGFSGDYNDLTNRPTIPTVPTNVSELTNDAGYITDFTETQVLSISNDTIYLTGGSYVKLPAGFSGDYNDLTNKPTIPTVPTNVSEFTNDAGYITSFTEAQVLSIGHDTIYLTGGSYVKLPAGFSGDYNDLTNKPTIPTVPTNVSEFTNDAGYLTSFSEAQVLSIGHDTIYLTGGSYVKLPAGFSGNYNDLTNKPTIPTVPTNVSEFTNDAGYITSYSETDPVFTAWNKDYNDLTNKPTIPTVPTNVSEFTNDAGYLTSFTEAQVLSISNDTIYLTGGSFVKLPAGFSGDYNDLTNKPTIPTVPTNLSEFTNDAGYLTSFSEAQVLSIGHDTIYLTGGSYVKLPAGFSGDYNDLTNKPTIPTVPTNVSDFTNDAGYITSYTETQNLADVAANGNEVNAQIKNLSDPTETLDAVNKKTLDEAIAALMVIIEQQARAIDSLKSASNFDAFAYVGGFDDNGSSKSYISVSASKQVRFSKGNLQYTSGGTHTVAGGSTLSGTWRFAENQWDIIGADNANINNATYMASGYIDLFGYGTSGIKHEVTSGMSTYSPPQYMPTSYVQTYNVYNRVAYWGEDNAISNGGNEPGLWRTLTQAEWIYIFYERQTSRVGRYANARFARISVSGVTGYLVFPDLYIHPSDVAIPSINEYNGEATNYSASDFNKLELAGCVFLPNAGFRQGTNVVVGGWRYWAAGMHGPTTGAGGVNYAIYDYFIGSNTGMYCYDYMGNAVRLVQDVE